MFSRVLRTVPRALPAARSASVAHRAIPAVRAITPLIPRYAFSTTPRRLGSGETDQQLSSALAAEHAYEVEAASAMADTEPEFLDIFRSQGIWEIQDKSMTDDVVLVRKFGNETLRLTFQISDMEDTPPALEPLDDSGNPIDPESSVDGETPEEPTYIACSLVISKQAVPGSMAVDLEAGEDGFEVTNVAIFESDVAALQGAEGDWERRSRYMGPQFDHLDTSVQEAFNSFLAERGIDDTLAQFILQYCEYKEQKDYVTWLNALRAFVDQ